MCSTRHVYGGADATQTLKTDYGTFHMCDDCATTAAAGGFVVSTGPLASETQRQACECEHADHFDAPVVQR